MDNTKNNNNNNDDNNNDNNKYHTVSPLHGQETTIPSHSTWYSRQKKQKGSLRLHLVDKDQNASPVNAASSLVAAKMS